MFCCRMKEWKFEDRKKICDIKGAVQHGGKKYGKQEVMQMWEVVFDHL